MCCGVTEFTAQRGSTMTNSRRWLIALFLLSASIVGICANPEVLDKRLLLLAGDAPVDCGTVGIREDASTASACAKRAFSANEAFIVRYRLQGIDSEVLVALAGTKHGHVYAVQYDSMGWSSDGLGKRARRLDANHNIVEPCPAPMRLSETGSHRLTCFPPDARAKGNIMSPTLGPY
jgi:hypothetical protein